MTFDVANYYLSLRERTLSNEGYENFGLEFMGSICDFCERRFECNAREFDDEEGQIISKCKYYKGTVRSMVPRP